MAERGIIPVHCGKVSRRHIYRQLRLNYISAKYLDVGGEHFRRHDQILVETGAPARKWQNLPALITAFLVDQQTAGKLVLKVKGQGVSREWIATALDLPHQLFNFNKAAAAALDAFNATLEDVALQAHGKHRDLHLAMAKFLAAGWAAGTLRFGPDGVDRKWLAEQFGVHNPIYCRYPETARVVDEFNAKVRDKLPASPTYPNLASDLRELLADLTNKGELPVFKDRLNETELARLLSVARGTFELVPECVEILKAAKHAVRFGDPLRPYHHGHGRNYSFHALAAAYGRSEAANLAKRFCDVAGPRAASAKQQYRLGLDVLGRVSHLLDAGKVAAIGAGRPVRGPEVEAALRQWRMEHLEGTGERQNLSGNIVTAHALLNRMKLFGDATEVLIPLPNASSSRPKRSLAEATVRQSEGVAEVVATYARTRQLDYDKREVEAFISNLALAGDLADVTVEQLPEAIRKLNRERLDRIVACANLTFQKGIEKHQRGLELLERGRGQVKEMDALFAELASGARVKRQLIRFFTKRGEDGLGAFLLHVERDHDGLYPRAAKGKETAEKVFYQRITGGLGGPEALEGLLHLSEEAIAAACLVYITEAGANSSVGRELYVDCLHPSSVPGYKRVEGWKERSGKPIVIDLPVDHRDGTPSAVNLLEVVQDAHARLARHVGDGEKRHLFLADTVGRVQPIEEHRLLHLLREIAKLDPALGEFDLRVDMIRSSVLLDAALSADGNMAVANAIANHSREDMTSHYVLKMPLRIIYERKIREFQDRFESVLVEGVEDASKRLGLVVEKVKERSASAMRTGLGRMCLKPTEGIQPGTRPGEVCDKVQACPSCRASVVIADVELVTELVIWHGSLVEAADTWPSEREDHFAEHWLDDLAFCEVAIEALGRGPHVRVLRKARQLAEQRLADPDYERPRPW